MDRLTTLKLELELIKNLRCLSYDLLDKCIEWYEHEIECIEKYGAANPEYPDTVEEYIKIPRKSLKYRGKDFVFYNVNWLREHWKSEERLLLENPLVAIPTREKANGYSLIEVEEALKRHGLMAVDDSEPTNTKTISTDNEIKWHYKTTADTLVEIRAEIEAEIVHEDWDIGNESIYNNAIRDCLAIIDKHIGKG